MLIDTSSPPPSTQTPPVRSPLGAKIFLLTCFNFYLCHLKNLLPPLIGEKPNAWELLVVSIWGGSDRGQMRGREDLVGPIKKVFAKRLKPGFSSKPSGAGRRAG